MLVYEIISRVLKHCQFTSFNCLPIVLPARSVPSESLFIPRPLDSLNSFDFFLLSRCASSEIIFLLFYSSKHRHFLFDLALTFLSFLFFGILLPHPDLSNSKLAENTRSKSLTMTVTCPPPPFHQHLSSSRLKTTLFSFSSPSEGIPTNLVINSNNIDGM